MREVRVLIVGTTGHLEDLDRTYTYADDVSVTAVAVGSFDGGVGSLLPASPRPVWGLLDGRRIVRLDEFDLTPVASLPDATAQSLAALPEGGLLVGLAGARLLTVSRDGAVAEVGHLDDGAAAATAQPGSSSSRDLRSVAVSSTGIWYANVDAGGVWRSSDRGKSWRIVVPTEAAVHEVVVGDGRRVVAAAANGFGWSQDDGDTWQWTTEGLHAAYSRAVALDGDQAFVTVSTGPETTDARLYRCQVGSPLEQCAGGLPESFPFNLGVGSVAASAGQVALGAPDGRIFRSSDGGSTFSLSADRLRHVSVLRFT
ncbi:MAG: hypothetical protein ABR925_01775 [Acidimicrobiales bacterium]